MEYGKSADDKYRIELLTRDTFPGALTVIKDSFCQDESVSIGTEINKNPAAGQELLELCADAALDGVSLVAVEEATNQVAAVAFNKIQVPSTGSTERTFFEIFAEERCKEASSRALIKYMADVDAQCNLFERLNVDCSLEIMFLATLREHRNKTLATLLCKASIQVAESLKNGPVSKLTVADLGPKYSHMQDRCVTSKPPQICQAIWTGPGTQKIGKKLGFKVYLTMPYTEFEYNGKTYEDRIGKGTYCEVAAYVLSR